MASMEFTEWIRGRTDEELRTLVSARPELISPVPAHLEGLAARAGSPSAIARVLDRLDRFTLAVVETLAVHEGPIRKTALRELVGGALAAGKPEPALGAALARLRDLALVYGPDSAIDLAPGVRKVLEDPAGLGPIAEMAFRHHPPEQLTEMADEIAPGTTGSGRERLAAALADPAALIDQVSPEARHALEQLAWGPPTGRVPNARREVRLASARSPIEQLLARGLLAATGEESVTLPREVGLHLRGGRVHRDLLAVPPALEGTARDQAMADRTAAGQAFMFVRAVEELCERWSIDPPGVLRTGGLGVRDMKRTASELDLPEWATALVVEVAHAAGLTSAGGSVDGEWLPTSGYDLWRIRGTADRWVVLAAAWLQMDRVPGLVGERDDRDRPLNALHPDLRRSSAPAVRAATLGVLDAAPGLAPSRDSVLRRLAWEQPRRRGAAARAAHRVRAARGRAARRHRARHAVRPRARPARGRRRRLGAGPAAARAGRSRAAAGRPDGGRAGAADQRAEPLDDARRRRGVQGRRDGLPVRRELRTTRPRRRAGGRGAAGHAGAPLRHARPPGAVLPDLRRGPPARPDAGRHRRPPTSAATTRRCSTRSAPTAARPRCACAGWRPRSSPRARHGPRWSTRCAPWGTPPSPNHWTAT